MEKIKALSTIDKIRLLEYVKRNYNNFSQYWSARKIEWLQELIDSEVRGLSNFIIE